MSQAINIKGSIRRRLVLILCGGALILSLGLFFAFQRLAIQLAEESQDNILRASATAILDSASAVGGELDLDLPYSAFSMLSNVSNDRVFYAIRANRRFLTGYQDLPVPRDPDPSAPVFLTTQYQQETVRMVMMTRIVSTGANPLRLTIAIAQTQDGQAKVIDRVLRIATLVGVGVFTLVVILAILSARATIDPLVRLAKSVGRRGPAELRPVEAPVPVEMVPLVAALNSFMDRLATSLLRTEEFIADAAHRLRTPLAIVRTRAEATLMRVDKEENRAALKDMIRAIDESSRAAGQMLDHAMVTLRTDNLETNQLDLGQMLRELVERMSPTAELRDITLVTDIAPGLTLSGDPVLIQSALRNVLENALKYSPAESQVILTARAENGFARVSICDQGVGFPPEKIDKLVARYARGDNFDTMVGSGLGLTIASDVVKAHGGKLEINNNPGDGACVTLYFSLS